LLDDEDYYIAIIQESGIFKGDIIYNKQTMPVMTQMIGELTFNGLHNTFAHKENPQAKENGERCALWLAYKAAGFPLSVLNARRRNRLFKRKKLDPTLLPGGGGGRLPLSHGVW